MTYTHNVTYKLPYLAVSFVSIVAGENFAVLRLDDHHVGLLKDRRHYERL